MKRDESRMNTVKAQISLAEIARRGINDSARRTLAAMAERAAPHRQPTTIFNNRERCLNYADSLERIMQRTAKALLPAQRLTLSILMVELRAGHAPTEAQETPEDGA
jgi:hypothetical protein